MIRMRVGEKGTGKTYSGGILDGLTATGDGEVVRSVRWPVAGLGGRTDVAKASTTGGLLEKESAKKITMTTFGLNGDAPKPHGHEIESDPLALRESEEKR